MNEHERPVGNRVAEGEIETAIDGQLSVDTVCRVYSMDSIVCMDNLQHGIYGMDLSIVWILQYKQ